MLDDVLTISNISNLSMITNSTFGGTGMNVIINCQHQASFNVENVKEVQINGLRLVGCGNNTFLSVQNFIIANSTFQGLNDSGTALYVFETALKIVNSSFISNRLGTCVDIIGLSRASMSNVSVHVGGVIFVDRSNITIMNSIFVNNSAEVGGVIYSTSYKYKNNISISNSIFVGNQAINISPHIQHCDWPSNHNKTKTVGGVLAAFQSRVIITNCTFINNTSEGGGAGVLSIQQKSDINVSRSEFHSNSAEGYAGVLLLREANVTINTSIFLKNRANQGGVMHAIQLSVILLRWNTFSNNSANFSGGVLSIDQTCQVDDYHGLFIYNRATTGGVMYAIRSSITLEDSMLSYNQAKEMGGALYVLQSHHIINFNGQCNITYNSARTGGGICAVESTLLCFGSSTVNVTQLSITFNSASYIGGGIYFYRSTFNAIHNAAINISSNSANSSGGGIHAINSLIICTEYYLQLSTNWPYQTLIIFANNSALNGGGLFLEDGTQLRIQKVGDLHRQTAQLSTSILFAFNVADEHGSAVYVADETYFFDVCDGGYNSTLTDTSYAECFFQLFSEARDLTEEPSIANLVEFRKNDSPTSLIFGGLLDRCVPDPRRAQVLLNDYGQIIDGFTYLKLISNINNTGYISSLPVRVCFCTLHEQPDCSYKPPTIHVKKGETFIVSLVAVDQVNHTLENVTIYGYFNNTECSLGEGQSTQVTEVTCTNLTFSIYSPHVSEELILYPEGPCRNTKGSISRVVVNFKPCLCPIGFQNQSNREDDCVCVCDVRLSPYFTEAENNCNFQTESLVRQGNFWIDFINGTNENKDFTGFLKHPYCPLDYCLPPTSKVYINLNLINGADAQCANNRSGLLCSLCQSGLSLSLGSSRCIPCSKMQYIPLNLAFLIAGILLVGFLMILNLTVGTGTLNGLIFYVNIIGANSSTFFSGLSPSTRYYSILASWLNLEVGFDVCFFEGMDTYWKTWVNLAFPMYIIVLVVLVITVSEKSMRFSRLIGKANPVATLATLILLSYTKFLQATITSLSFTQLDYPDGSRKRVWLPDATVEYLSRKHILLFVVAILILVTSTAYTCTIFFWQWLLHYQDKIIFKWARSQRLCHFIEPYHAPYISKHRYWTGLLLFIRIALYLIFALNVSGDPGVDLLAIVTSMVGLFMIKGQIGRVYKSAFVDVIEMACYTNLGVLSTIKLTFEDKNMVSIAAHISGAFMVMLLAIIISYHLYAVLSTKCSKRLAHIMNERQLYESATANTSAARGSFSNNNMGKPTFSALYLGQPDCDRKRLAEVEINVNDDQEDRASLASIESTSPLLEDCH